MPAAAPAGRVADSTLSMRINDLAFGDRHWHKRRYGPFTKPHFSPGEG
jgi:hypothetical protein